jgi:hypothetical protein
MCGLDNANKHKVSCKGAESRTMLGFAVQLAKEHRGAIGPTLADAGEYLLKLYELFRLQQRHSHAMLSPRDQGKCICNLPCVCGLNNCCMRRLSRPDRVKACELAYGFLMAYAYESGHWSPKHHLFCHLMHDIQHHGNPRCSLGQPFSESIWALELCRHANSRPSRRSDRDPGKPGKFGLPGTIKHMWTRLLTECMLASRTVVTLAPWQRFCGAVSCSLRPEAKGLEFGRSGSLSQVWESIGLRSCLLG